MEYANGFSQHLSRASLTGPAERTIVEPWLSELTRLPLNAYPDEPLNAHDSRPLNAYDNGPLDVHDHRPLDARVVTMMRGVRPSLGHAEGLAVA
ncbi:hypothetical protein AB0L06_28465 [Spirillospora sp. NPDC052269]